MMLVKDMSMNAVSRLVKEHETRPWLFLHYYVDNTLANQDLSHVTKVNTDGTSSIRSYSYITVFVDSIKKNVIHVTKGKDASTWESCKERLEAHEGDAANETEVCMDMSPSFMKGASDYFPDTTIMFDNFNVIQKANKAFDSVRRHRA